MSGGFSTEKCSVKCCAKVLCANVLSFVEEFANYGAQ